MDNRGPSHLVHTGRRPSSEVKDANGTNDEYVKDLEIEGVYWYGAHICMHVHVRVPTCYAYICTRVLVMMVH